MVGTGIGFDFSQLMTQFSQLDAELKKLTVSGKNFGASMQAVFANMTKGDFKNFAAQIKQLRSDVVSFGKVKAGLNWDSTSLQNYINDVNKLILVIKQIREGAKGSQELKGSGISIQGLRKEVKEAQELLAIVKKVEQQMKKNTYDRNTSFAGATAYSNNAVSLQQNAKAVEYLIAARNKLKTTDADYLTKLEDLNTRIQKHNEILHRSKQTNREAAEEAKKTADATKRASDQMLRTPAELVGMKGSAKTMNELRLYAEQLRKTMNTLNPKSEEWKKLNGILQQTERQISRVENKMKGLNGVAGVFKNALSGIGRMFAMAFAVDRLWQYSKAIVSVTGEFEQMQVALKTIIGNTEDANRIWGQTMELAKNSPFQARELIKYTRQLAAYRIETNKLHDTTKMLADVSAGLGVDMSRLILAYGQVRAAEYLRGTELRQFTEAGVPMLEELAKHFSKLEGHAVSTAEVFAMISKRQVVFSDVSAVLEGMTSEGGPFYKMQEVMSDTIKGSISNLKDEVDLMMYEIGQSNDGVIKGTLNLLRSLVRNWAYVGATIKTVAVALVAYKLAAKSAALSSFTIAGAWTAIKASIVKATVAIKGFLASLGPIGWAITILSTLTTAFLSFRAAKQDANKDDEKAAELADELKAIDKQYGELTQSIEKYGDAFREAVKTGNISEMEVQLTRMVELAKEKYSIVFDVKIEGATEEELKATFDNVNNTLSEAGIFASNFQKAFEKKDPYRDDGEYSLYAKETEMLEHWEQNYARINKHVEQLLKDDKTKDLFRKYEAGEDPLAYMLEYYRARYKLAKDEGHKMNDEAFDALNTLSSLQSLREAYVTEIKKMVGGKFDWGEGLSLNLGAALTGLIDRDQIDERATEAWKSALESVFDVDKVSVHVDDGMDDWEVKFNKFIKDRREKTKEAIKQAGLDDEAELGDSFRLGGTVVALLNEDNTKTRQELAKYLKEQRDIQKEIIDAIATGAQGYSDVEKAAAEIKYKELDAAITYLAGNTVNKGGNSTDKTLEKLKQQLSMIKEMNSEFEKLTKDMTDEASKAQVKKSFLESAKAIGLDISEQAFDDAGAIEMLQNLLADKKYKSDKYQTEIKKILDNFLVQEQVEGQQEQRKNLKSQVDALFDRNELTKQMKELGINEDVAEQLFGFDALSLDGLRSEVEGLRDAFYATGKDGEKAYEEYIKKVEDMELKSQQERMKKYMEYSRNSLGEMAKIRMEQLKKLEEIEEAFKPKDGDTPEVAQMKRDEKARATAKAKSDADEALAKMEWENFRKSETFTSLMDDLSGASDAMLSQAIEDLEAFKNQWSDLPVDQMQEVVKLINKAKRAQDTKDNPWAEAKRLRGNITADGRTREQAELDSYNAEMENIQLQEELQMITLIQQQRNAGVTDAQIRLAIGEKYAHLLKEEVNLTDRVDKINDKIVKNRDKINKSQGRIQDEKDLVRQYNKQKDVLDEINNQAQKVYDSFKSLYEAVGGDGEDALATFADMGMQMASTVLQTISLQISLKAVETGAYAAGTALNTAMGVIGWIVMAVQLLAAAFTAIAKYNDKKWEKIIEEQTKKVETLQKQYEKLEEAIEGAWNFRDIQDYNEEMMSLTESMITAQKAAIAARKQQKDYRKGKSDAIDEVREMEDELAELEKQLNESLKDSFSKVTDGILDDVLDAAKGFTDAWYEAFKETGDGLSGLEENFEEMFMNLAKNQASGLITGKFVEQWKDALGYYINEKDTTLTADEAAAWASKVRESLPELNAALEAFLGTIASGLGESGGLSELQKGIQGITEDTAQVLEALLNSMRLYVADTNNEIRSQTEYIRKMYKFMEDSVSGFAPFYVQMHTV